MGNEGDVAGGPVLDAGLLGGAEGAHHFGRGAEHHGARRDFLVLGDEGTGTDDAVVADFDAVEQDGPHADEDFVSNGAGVKHGHVTDGDVVADEAAVLGGKVEHAAVLDVGAVAYGDAVDVAAKHGAIPDAGVLAKGDVSDERGRGGDEGAGGNVRLAQEEGRRKHG